MYQPRDSIYAWAEAHPVVQVNGLPERVVSRVERAAVGIELVGEDELHVAVVHPGRLGVRGLGRVGVDECEAARDDRHLRADESHLAQSGYVCAKETLTWPVEFVPPMPNAPKVPIWFWLKCFVMGSAMLEHEARRERARAGWRAAEGHAQERQEAEDEDAEAAEIGDPAPGEEATAVVEHARLLLGPVQLVIVLDRVPRNLRAPQTRVRPERPLAGCERAAT
jgi:hypothetical protein